MVLHRNEWGEFVLDGIIFIAHLSSDTVSMGKWGEHTLHGVNYHSGLKIAKGGRGRKELTLISMA